MPAINPHIRIAPGTQGACPTNVVTFTDYPIVADVTFIRKIHVDQLRAAINAEQTRRSITNTVWTDPTITANQTVPRKPHMSEARDSIYAIREPSGYPTHSCPANQDVPASVICPADQVLIEIQLGGTQVYCTYCQDYCTTNIKGYCPSDLSAAITWTDDPLIADQTHVRAVHMNEVMADINIQKQQCVCEQERCNYCADCGYAYKQWYQSDSHPGCFCDNNQSSECTNHIIITTYYWVSRCATFNSSETDFVAALTANLYEGISSGNQVPWNCMCSFTPAGRNWTGTKAAWGCMCNPFSWST